MFWACVRRRTPLWGDNMSSQKGDPKSREFKNLKKVLEGINNDRN